MMMRLIQKQFAPKDEFAGIDESITDANVKAALTAQAEARQKANQEQLQREIIDVFESLENSVRESVEQIRSLRKREAKAKAKLALYNEAIDLAKQGNFLPALTLLGCAYPGMNDEVDEAVFNAAVPEKFRNARC